MIAEPDKQFALCERHIMRIREREVFRHSEIVVMVERNLGFEAEHHHRALSGIPLTRHRVDHQAQRYGVLTTEEVSGIASCCLTVDMIGVVISSHCTTLCYQFPFLQLCYLFQ